MHIDFTKTSHILFFAALLPAISFGIGWAFTLLLPDVPFWVETISPLGAYGLLFSLFNRFGWQLPIFSWLGVVTMPDLRGRWIGEQRSSFSHNGKNVTSRVVLEITQTFDAISATTYYKRWQTSHCDANFMRLDGKPYLVLLFESEPNSLHSGDDGAQKGVTRLYYTPNDKKLIGHYFNSNGNHGEVVLTRHSFKLRQAFE